MLTALIRMALDQLPSGYAEQMLIAHKYDMDPVERLKFIESVEDIDYLLAEFSAGENNGFAYRLPDEKNIVETIRKEYDVVFKNTTNAEVVSKIDIIESSGGTYFQIQRV